MATKTFNLVNPRLVGTFDSSVKAKNAEDAMSTFWGRMTKHIEGNVPAFNATLQEGSGKKLHHFRIRESVHDGDEAVTDIKKLDVKMSSKGTDDLLKRSASASTSMQNGGRRRRKKSDDEDDSSSSDSEDDNEEYYRFLKYRKRVPISLAWYAPNVYSRTKSVDIFVPVWRRPHFVYTDIYLGRF